MQIRETFEVAAAPGSVWASLELVGRAARCVPGVTSVEVLGPERSRGAAAPKVGFISARTAP